MDRKPALNHTAVNYYAQLLHSGKLRVQKWSEGWAQCWLHLCLPQWVLIHCNTGLVGPVLSPLSKQDRSIVPHRLWQTPPSVHWALWQLTEENGHRLMHVMQNWTTKSQSILHFYCPLAHIFSYNSKSNWWNNICLFRQCRQYGLNVCGW